MNTYDHPPTPKYAAAERFFRRDWLGKRGLMDSDLARPDRDDLRRLYAEARDKEPELKLLKARADGHTS